MERASTNVKNVIDIPVIPKAEVTKHIIEACRCRSCHTVTVPKTGLNRGTSLGSNLLKFVAGLWKGKASYSDIADMLFGLFGMEGCAKSTVQHALGSTADAMAPEADSIKVEMDNKKTPVGIGETPHSQRKTLCVAVISATVVPALLDLRVDNTLPRMRAFVRLTRGMRIVKYRFDGEWEFSAGQV